MTDETTFIQTKRRIRMDPSRHRFQTKFSLAMMSGFLLVLTVLSFMYAPPLEEEDRRGRFLERATDDKQLGYERYSNYSCHQLFEETPNAGDDQCAFAKTCNDGEGVWMPFVFCSSRHSVKTLSGIMAPFVLLWMIIMFRLLGSTAEDYFSPSLEYFSVKAKLPPRFAGVTLLALGNGAADVSATVNAITSDKEHGYQMSLGALTGAAMFVGGVVSAVVVIVAGGVPCRGALVRDVLFLFITMIVLWVHFGRGFIGPEAVSLFFTLYGCFIILVLVADVYHRGVVLPRRAVQAQQRERERQLQAADDVNELVNGGLENSVALQEQQGGNFAIGNMLSALSNYQSNQGDDPNAGWGVDSEELQDHPIMLHGAHGIIRGNPRIQGERAPPAGDVGTPYSALEDAADRICAEPGPAGGTISYNWQSAWEEAKQELADHASQVWEDIMFDGDLHWAEKCLLLCELPFTFFRKVTVPIPCDGYYCRGLVALSMIVSPLWLAFYLWKEHHIKVFSGGALFYLGILHLIAFIVGALILRFAPAGEGNMALFAATPIALYGFLIGATWIDLIADNLVAMLDFIGIVLRIPGPIIGLTILAWGNSVADLSSNVAMARKNLSNMAMTACFAGPVFNILIGMGIGFSALAAKYSVTKIEVALSATVITGFVFVMVNCAAILGVGIFIGQGRIPKQHGYVALTLYTLYVVSSVGLQYM